MKKIVDLDAVRNELIALKDEAIAGYTKHKKDFEALESGYFNILPEAQLKSLRSRRKSALAPNLIKPKVDKIVRDMLKTFFGSDEIAKISPDDAADEHEMLISEVLNEELKDFARDSNLYSKCRPIARGALVYGTTITKVYWSVAENTIRVENCSLRDAYIDPHAQNSLAVKYLVHRVSSMTIADAKKQFSKAAVNWDDYVQSESGSRTQDNAIGDYQRVEFFDIYRKRGTHWYVSTLLSDDTILRSDVLLKDGLPFIVSDIEAQMLLIQEGDFPVMAYGSSFIAPLLPIQIENTIKRNQQIDASDLQLNQRFLTTSTSGLREEDLIANRKKLTVDSISNVRELPTPKLDGSIFNTQQLEQEAQEISGITKYSMGMNDKANLNQTATGMSILSQEGSSVIDDINRAWNESFFRPFINRCVLLLFKYKVSSRFYGIDRTKKLRQKIVINAGVGSTNKTLIIQNIDNAINSAMQSVKVFMSTQDIERAKKYTIMLDKLNEEKIKNLGLESVIEETNKEVEEAMMQIQAQRQQQMQGAM